MRTTLDRPRTTKLVYFFKSGDQSFSGVRLPVNSRKYKNLDSVLDDLANRVPGLPRGVRTLSTPHGRDKITELTQLRHMGSYVCSDRIQAKHIRGVNLAKIKGLSDPQLISAASSFYEEMKTEQPKRVRKIKKKKKRVKKKKQPVSADKGESESQKTSSIIGRLAEGSLLTFGQYRTVSTTKSVEPNLDESLDSIDNYADTANTWRQSEVTREDDEEDDDIIYENDGEFVELKAAQLEDGRNTVTKNGSDTGRVIVTKNGMSSSMSQQEITEGRPGSNSVFGKSNSEDQNELPPLDSNKLTHVQRRRVASNQVDPEQYTLPNGSQLGSARNQIKQSAITIPYQDIDVNRNDDPTDLRIDELLSLKDKIDTQNGEPIAEDRIETGTEARKEIEKRDLQSRQTDSGVGMQA